MSYMSFSLTVFPAHVGMILEDIVMAASAFVRARIDGHLKDEAASVLADLGLTVSDVVRMVLTKVAKEKALPFALKVPNDKTRAAMEEARLISRDRHARFASAEDLIGEQSVP